MCLCVDVDRWYLFLASHRIKQSPILCAPHFPFNWYLFSFGVVDVVVVVSSIDAPFVYVRCLQCPPITFVQWAWAGDRMEIIASSSHSHVAGKHAALPSTTVSATSFNPQLNLDPTTDSYNVYQLCRIVQITQGNFPVVCTSPTIVNCRTERKSFR